jgi:hypothetical protein
LAAVKRAAPGLVTFYLAYLLAVAIGAAWEVRFPPYNGSAEQQWANWNLAMGWAVYVAAVALVGNALVYWWALRRLPRLPAAYALALQTAAGLFAAELPSLPIPGMSFMTALFVVPAAVSAGLYFAALTLLRQFYGRESERQSQA